MSGTLHSLILKEIAERAVKQVVAETIRQMKRSPTCSGRDHGLGSLWEEYCIQVQLEQSYEWEIYLDTAKIFVEANIDGLQRYEAVAIWLQSDNADEWEDDETVDHLFPSLDDFPLPIEACVDYVVEGALEDAAYSQRSRRIDRFLRRYESLEEC